jgi:hypothetical protein
VKLNDTPFAPLVGHLLDVLHELEGQDIPLIIAGGFGLLLRRQWLEAAGTRTLIENIPSARATEDFDVVLRLEVLADTQKLTTLRHALDRLGYKVVIGAEKYQFIKPDTAWGAGRNVKVDLLARQPAANDARFRADTRRVRPRGNHNPLHAHVTPEAIAVEEDLLEITIEGSRPTRETGRGIVYLPHPYATLLMKLFAFRDEHEGRKGNGREPYARKHAGDLFSIAAMLSAEENDALNSFRERHQASAIAREAAGIVQDYFSTPSSSGMLRLREALGGREPAEFALFLGVLGDTFLV